MNSIERKAHNVAANPWFIVLGTLCSILSFFWVFYEEINDKLSVLAVVSLGFSLVVFLAGVVYSLTVRSENKALKKVSETFSDINHVYRDALFGVFGSENPVTDLDTLIELEKDILKSVCQRIGQIFSILIGVECMATVKMIVRESDERIYAQTHVRSVDNHKRDTPERKKYSINTGENTAFDEALKKRADGGLSYFWSTDLTKEGENYANQRLHYSKYYRSTIVVPIRGHNKDREGHLDEFDLIGFLCIDTKSTNRLKNGYHIHIMTSLAGQMYNFMSLMRGKYTVFVYD